MHILPNDWDRIRVHYANWHDDIMRAGSNEWGAPAYAWDEGFLHFTPIETWLWEHIRACDAVLYPQYPVDRFFVDFANPVAKVAVECDGAAYHTDKSKDAARDARLQALGWHVYRITGSDCAHENDRETGAPGRAHQFIHNICEQHGISRNSRTREDEWETGAEMLEEYMLRALQIRAATKRGIRL
jgi:hypothetical protein